MQNDTQQNQTHRNEKGKGELRWEERGELTNAKVTRAEVECLVRDYFKRERSERLIAAAGCCSASASREEYYAWTRIGSFIDIGAISQARVEALYEEVFKGFDEASEAMSRWAEREYGEADDDAG